MEHGDIVGPAQPHRLGLDNGDFRPFRKMSQRDRRKAAVGQERKMEAERREVHLNQCAQQGQVTRWEEHVVERKIGWSDIWEWNTSRLSFLLQSTYNVLPSPVNLIRWKVQEVDKCRCGKLGTMKHILSNCHLALNRYTWRHNQVLMVLTEMAKEQVEEGKYAPKPHKHGLVKIDFVPQGGKVPNEKMVSHTGGSCRSEGLWEIFLHPNIKKARPSDMERGREKGEPGGAHGASWRQYQFGTWAERQSLWGSCWRVWGGGVESYTFPSQSWLQRIHRD